MDESKKNTSEQGVESRARKHTREDNAASDFAPIRGGFQMGQALNILPKKSQEHMKQRFPMISTQLKIDEHTVADVAAEEEAEVLHDEKAAKSQEKNAAGGSRQVNKPVTLHGAYGARASALDINRHLWEDTAHNAWADTPTGRFAIRLFSRGFLGAAFFTAGGLLTRKWMTGANQYDALASITEQKNPLQLIAKSIDVVAGKPIESAVTALAGEEAGLAAVRFRPTRYTSFGNKLRGRSLGDEVVNVTFDFFSASVGDAMGRDIASALDPNVDKSYIDDKGHFKPKEAAKAFGKSAFRWLSYNGGEDWAVALPYVYFMKGQRNVINHISPGFSHDFDRQLNGGSFKLNNNKLVGNFNKEGALDFQTRFTFYNIGTLMYRELYDYVGNKALGNHDVRLYGSRDEDNSRDGPIESAGKIAKWALRSAVKGTIIMTPSVPFFWGTRAPQSKHRSLFIDPEKGTLGLPPGTGRMAGDSVHANSTFHSPDRVVDYWQYQNQPGAPLHKHGVVSGTTTIGKVLPEMVGGNFNPHGQTFGVVDSLLNALGESNYRVATQLKKPADWLDKNFASVTGPVKDALGIKPHEGFSRFTSPMSYAAFSYMPYMYAKSEAANLWDNGKMDLAAERLIDGATSFNWGEFKKGAHEVWRSVTFKDLPDEDREIEAQRRMWLDTSPADDFETTQAQQFARKHKIPVSWRDKVFSGPTVRVPEKEPYKNQHIAKHISNKKREGRYADHEELRRMLEELSPPTNSIN